MAKSIGRSFYPTKIPFGYGLSTSNGEHIRGKYGKIKFDYPVNEKTKKHNRTFTMTSKESGTSAPCERLEFFTNQQAIAELPGFKYINVNFETGDISPVFRRALNNLYLDQDNKFFTLNDEGKAVYNGYEYIDTGDERPYARDYLPATDESGKVGFITHHGEIACPCIFGKLEDIEITKPKFRAEIKALYERNTGKLVLLMHGKTKLNAEFENCEIFTSENHISIYEKDKNKSTIYRYDNQKASLEYAGEMDDKIETVVEIATPFLDQNDPLKREYNIYYIGGENKGTLYEQKTGRAIIKGHEDIVINDVKGNKVVQYKDNIGGKNYIGLISLEDEKTILDSKEKCTEAYYKGSVEMKDGSLRLLVAKDEVENGETKKVWGVIDSNGSTLVDFEYKNKYDHFNEERITSARHSLYRSAYEMIGKDGKKAYLNLNYDPIVQKEDEIKIYHSSSYSSSSSSWHGSVKSEDKSYQRMGMAMAIGIATGNPAAGLAVYNMLDDEMDM